MSVLSVGLLDTPPTLIIFGQTKPMGLNSGVCADCYNTQTVSAGLPPQNQPGKLLIPEDTGFQPNQCLSGIVYL